MSSLIFYTDATQVVVATDTLAVTPDGRPMLFSSKAHHLPHLRTIIAGTGMGMFAGDWAMEVNNRMILEGIMNLDYHAPGSLRAKWAKYRKDFALPDNLTTSVYHFGLSEDDQSVVAFAYRSTSDFQSERLPQGFGIKPECPLPEGNNMLEIIPQMMNLQRDIQSKVPPAERIYIGGEVIVMHLTASSFNVFHPYSFPERDEDMRSIFQCHASRASQETPPK